MAAHSRWVSAVASSIALLFCPSSASLANDGGDGGDSLITAADIEREKPADLVELLRSRVGLDESNSVITMRGVKGIAIFVDGFASSMAELGALKPGQVERIEVLRGAASARFGAEAMGGAIAVTTRGVRNGMRGSFVQGLDSRGGRYSRLSGTAEMAAFGAALMLEDRDEEGFRSVPDSPFPYQVTVSDERGKTQLADGKLSWRGNDLELSLNLKRADNYSFFGRPWWYFDTRTDNARGQISWQWTADWRVDAAVGEQDYETAGVRDRGTGIDAAGLAPERWLTQTSRQREASLGVTYVAGEWQWQAGGNAIESSEHFGAADYASRHLLAGTDSLLRRYALFASLRAPLAQGQIELALRRDWQRYVSSRVVTDAAPPATGGGIVKSATSPKLALSWPLGTNRLRASLGSGFSPPQAWQLYHSDVGAGAVTLANPDLKPERSLTADIGIVHQGAGELAATVFATRWQDKIGMRIVDYGIPVVQQPQNTGRVAAHGVELQWSGKFGTDWSAAANYTHTRTRVVEDLADASLVGKELPDMPRHKANLALTFTGIAGVDARIKLRAVGPRFTDDANTVVDGRGYRWQKAGFAVLDLAATWRRSWWEFTLALDNALDRDYVSGFFWHQSPRLLRGELTMRF